MKVLTIRTDNPTAEIGLYKDQELIGKVSWQAHHELTKTIHLKIKELLNKSNVSLKGIDGIVCYKGPGSFTGLRIGLSVANTLAYILAVPIVAPSKKDWIKTGIADLQSGKNDIVVTPNYSHPASVTKPH